MSALKKTLSSHALKKRKKVHVRIISKSLHRMRPASPPKSGRPNLHAIIATLKARLSHAPDLIALVEDLQDKLDIDEARKRHVRADAMPEELVARIISGESPLRVWREFRKISGKELAASADVSASYLNEVEAKKKPGSIDFWKKCANALGVSMDDLAD